MLKIIIRPCGMSYLRDVKAYATLYATSYTVSIYILLFKVFAISHGSETMS